MNSVLNISEAASIAIHSLALIASAPSRINVSQLAQATHFSKNHIAKILQILAKKGYLSADRGPKGGYVLLKDAKSITLMEIYELIDGRIESVHCSVHDEGCPFSECVFGTLREQVSSELREYLTERTIYHIINVKDKNNETKDR